MSPALSSVYVMLHAQDMDRAVAFWRDVMGLGVKTQSPEWTELTFGDTVIAFHGGGDGSENPSGLGFDSPDMDGLCEAIAAAGGTIRMPPTDRPEEGIRLAEFSDPEGNIVMLSAPFNPTV